MYIHIKRILFQQWYAFGKLEYMLSDTETDHNNALTECENKDGTLAIADIDDIHIFLNSLMIKKEKNALYWVGAYVGI